MPYRYYDRHLTRGFDSMKKNSYISTRMKTLHGIMVSPGIAIGRAFCYHAEKLVIPQYDIPPQQLEYEMQRFYVAVELASNEIDELRKKSKEHEGGELLESHLLMLNDPELIGAVKQQVYESQKNVEWTLFQVAEDMIRKLSASTDSYLRDRTIDIHDVVQRILGHLMFKERTSLANLKDPVILVAHTLMPSDTVAMNKQAVLGIATDAGGKTSHTAILARSFEIPAVLGLSDVSIHIKDGDEVIVDGNTGSVIIDPDEETVEQFRVKQSEWQKHEQGLQALTSLPAETVDGKLICVEANIELPDEIESVMAHGADGIGLYRSEFLFLQSDGYPSEESQYRAYRRVIEAMGDRVVTIRTLDLGGDKVIPGFKAESEPNPILGWRAIRFCLSRPEVFRTQLRALFRAAVHGNLRVMFPMISSVEELSDALSVAEAVKSDLSREGVPYKDDVEIGIMIEIPSAAFTSDILATKVDFFSIGTNDLIQYTIAVDRGNERIAYLYEPFHPGVLRLIRMIIENGHAAEIPVGMCGEMAGEPLATVVLLGLGLDEFSMSAIGIPEIKNIIRSVSYAEAQELVGSIMEMNSLREIDGCLREWMGERFGHVVSQV